MPQDQSTPKRNEPNSPLVRIAEVILFLFSIIAGILNYVEKKEIVPLFLFIVFAIVITLLLENFKSHGNEIVKSILANGIAIIIFLFAMISIISLFANNGKLCTFRNTILVPILSIEGINCDENPIPCEQFTYSPTLKQTRFTVNISDPPPDHRYFDESSGKSRVQCIMIVKPHGDSVTAELQMFVEDEAGRMASGTKEVVLATLPEDYRKKYYIVRIQGLNERREHFDVSDVEYKDKPITRNGKHGVLEKCFFQLNSNTGATFDFKHFDLILACHPPD